MQDTATSMPADCDPSDVCQGSAPAEERAVSSNLYQYFHDLRAGYRCSNLKDASSSQLVSVRLGAISAPPG